jgi:hypothetical protein
MQSKATTVDAYLSELADDRRAAIEAVRKVILANLDKGFEEGMQYGMIGYYVPHNLYPAGYHCDPKQPLPFACLASQKNHMSLYMMSVYGDASLKTWFESEWKKTGKKLDMGKSCIRFKKAQDLALDVIGAVIRRVTLKKYIEVYETAFVTKKKPAKPAKKVPGKSAATKKAPVKKAAATKPSRKKSPTSGKR